MEKLTKEQAIKECQELWKEIEESGLSKRNFLDTGVAVKWMGKDYAFECPLCEYNHRRKKLSRDSKLYTCFPNNERCNYCPLVKQYDRTCIGLGFSNYDIPTPEWLNAIRGLK